MRRKKAVSHGQQICAWGRQGYLNIHLTLQFWRFDDLSVGKAVSQVMQATKLIWKLDKVRFSLSVLRGFLLLIDIQNITEYTEKCQK